MGIVQGLTEFLPVSSSGHLEIGSVLLRTKNSDNLLFAIAVHLATALATIVVFRKDIFLLLKDLLKFQWNESTQFISKLLVSMVPVFLVGVLLKDQVEAFFTGNLLLVGAMLLITGLLLMFAHLKKDGGSPISFLIALVIGVAQAFAVLPGISRSGATIATGLLLGVDKARMARFSFLMVLIPIFGASLLEAMDYLEAPDAHTIASVPLIIGFIAAFISGFLACQWMIKIVRRGKLTYFAIYCFIVGITAILVTI